MLGQFTTPHDSGQDPVSALFAEAQPPTTLRGLSFAPGAGENYLGALRLDGLKTRVYGVMPTPETAPSGVRALADARAAYASENGEHPDADRAPFAWLPVLGTLAGLNWTVSSRPVGRWMLTGRSPSGVDFEYGPRSDAMPGNYGVLTVHFGAVWWLTRTLDDARALVPELARALGVGASLYTVSEVHVCCDVEDVIGSAGTYGRWRGYGSSHFSPRGSNTDPDGWSTVRPGEARPLDLTCYDKTREVEQKGHLHWKAWFDHVAADLGRPLGSIWRCEVRARREVLTARFGIDTLDSLTWDRLATVWRHALGGLVTDDEGQVSYLPGYLRLLTSRCARLDAADRRAGGSGLRPEEQAVSPVWVRLRDAAPAAPTRPARLAPRLASRQPHRQAVTAAGNLRSALLASCVARALPAVETVAREVEALAAVAHVRDRHEIARSLRALAAQFESDTLDPVAENVVHDWRESLRSKLKPVTDAETVALASCLVPSCKSSNMAPFTAPISSAGVPAPLTSPPLKTWPRVLSSLLPPSSDASGMPGLPSAPMT